MISSQSGASATGKFFMSLGVRRACIFKDGDNGSFLFSYNRKVTNHTRAVQLNNKSIENSSSCSSGGKCNIIDNIFDGFPLVNGFGEDVVYTSDGELQEYLLFRCFHMPAFNLYTVPDSVCKLSQIMYNISNPFSDGVVDTTGCGDNYCAGFIAGLCHNLNVYDSMR